MADLEEKPTEWEPLALTLVEYPKGDLIGKLFAITSLAPFGIGSGFIALILFRRDLHTIAFFVGTLLNEVINILLKHIFCEKRPLARGNLYNEYGMPSSHSQFIWFFSVYVLYFFIFRLHHIYNNNILSIIWKVLIVGSCFTLSIIVSVGRVYLEYHTTRQVIYGALVGFTTGSVWFAVVHKVLTPVFPQIANLQICEMLMIRDTTLIPNVLFFEYTKSRHEARTRGRKLAALKPVR